MRSLTTLAALALLACAPSEPPALPDPEPLLEQEGAVEVRPVIDMHMHAHEVPLPITEGGPAPCLPAPCEPRGEATGTPEASLQQTLKAMDEHHIVKAFVSTGDLDLLDTWVEAAPNRFMAGSAIWRPGEVPLEELKERLADGRLHGMGEIAAQLAGIPPNDPSLDPYFSLAEAYDVPVLIHTEGIGPPVPTFRVQAGSPLLLEDVLVAHPKLRLYVENAGYPFLDDMIAMMYQYPQLYADVSTITWIIPRQAFHRYLRELVEAGLGKRLMFGSDQMRWPEMIGEGIASIETADFLTEEQKRDILYHNAVRFLRLEPRDLE